MLLLLSNSEAKPLYNAHDLTMQRDDSTPVPLENFAILRSPGGELNPRRDPSLTFDSLDVCVSFMPVREADGRTSVTGDLCVYVWCVVWPYQGWVALKYKTSLGGGRRSVRADVNQRLKMRHLSHTLCWPLPFHADSLSAQIFLDWNVWQNSTVLQF